jgi:hypothetical protein
MAALKRATSLPLALAQSARSLEGGERGVRSHHDLDRIRLAREWKNAMESALMGEHERPINPSRSRR